MSLATRAGGVEAAWLRELHRGAVAAAAAAATREAAPLGERWQAALERDRARREWVRPA